MELRLNSYQCVRTACHTKTYIGKNLDYVYIDQAVALGASYGGYMISWIQGNPLGRRFKALVCHDGVFSMTGQLAFEEIYFPNCEFGGAWWDNKKEVTWGLGTTGGQLEHSSTHHS
jgi:Prolyl oligopeptidase family